MADDITQWLEGLGLGQYAQAFAENDIDFDVLPRLSDDHLEKLGLSLGDRLRLLDAVTALASDAPTPALPDAMSQSTDAIANTGERRRVAVLFVDLVGFTRLSNATDPEEVHDLLGTYFEAVDRVVIDHGGHIDKHIGDAVMGVFGAPISHGNDTERAVRAALEVHSALEEITRNLGREFRAHIGIATGEVVASGTGSSDHREYTVTGSSVNLASRLVSVAQPGETLLSDAARREVAQIADCTLHGEVSVKGFDQPIRAWCVRS